MNDKEAREIIGKGIPPPLQAIESIKYQHARSYLAGFDEALDKAKGLEEALENFLTGYDLGQFKITYKDPAPVKGIIPMFKEALSEWRKVK